MSAGASQPEFRVILAGVGRVGKDLTRLLSARPGYRVVAAYSRNAALAGQDLGLAAGIRGLGVTISGKREAALSQPADVLVVATTSFLREVAPDLRAGAEHGLNVMTTAEEAFYPWLTDAALAGELDRLAGERGVSILGVGLNPGFIFDALLLTASGIAWDVQSIRLRRVVDISNFSVTIQRRLGIGFSGAEFEAGVAAKTITGHIGFPQTFALLGHCLGVDIERVEKSFEPLLAEHRFESERLPVEAGQTAGFIQRVTGLAAAQPWITAEFIAHVQPADAGLKAEDWMRIEGYNALNLTISPGCNPQRGSAAMLANCIPRVVQARPGFITVADLTLPHAGWTRGEAL
jgi:hypothetical protein